MRLRLAYALRERETSTTSGQFLISRLEVLAALQLLAKGASLQRSRFAEFGTRPLDTTQGQLLRSCCLVRGIQGELRCLCLECSRSKSSLCPIAHPRQFLAPAFPIQLCLPLRTVRIYGVFVEEDSFTPADEILVSFFLPPFSPTADCFVLRTTIAPWIWIYRTSGTGAARPAPIRCSCTRPRPRKAVRRRRRRRRSKPERSGTGIRIYEGHGLPVGGPLIDDMYPFAYPFADCRVQ